MNRSRRTVLIIGAAAAVVVVVAIVLFALSNSPKPDDPRSGSPTAAASSTPIPPTPSVFPTPTPGATDSPPPVGEPVEEDLDATASPAKGVTVEVTGIRAFTSSSEQPGELAGPALEVTLRVSNDSGSALDLAGSSVNLTYGTDDVPAPPLGDPISTGLPGTIPAGESGEGEYSFSVPVDDRDRISVVLDLLSDAPQVVFTGAAPTR
ncbi:hypothetical protein AB0N64_04565 [Microbacterium sp. NPDC089318]